MKDKIRWGILGSGKIARKFASDLALVEDAQLVAIGSRNKATAELFANEFSVLRAHGSYEALVQDEQVDVIYVATPHSHHYENTLLCLNNNKAVLCEKAFAVNSRQAAEMIRVAKEKKIFLMEAMWTKFLPQHQQLLQFLKDGTLGDLKSVLMTFGFRPDEPVPARLFDPALAGGTLLDIGIYNVFMAMSVLGKPDFIDAHMTPFPSGADEQCAVFFKYGSGAMAQLFSSFASHLPIEAEISGTNGRIKLGHRFFALESVIEYFPGKPETRQIIESDKDLDGFGYQYETRHVCECLRKGLTESPVMTHNDTIDMMEVLDTIRSKAGIRYEADESVKAAVE